jgi:hypothetical protein
MAKTPQKSIILKLKHLFDPRSPESAEKKGGEKMVVSCLNLLKTNVEKMSLFRLAIMLMKTNQLNHSLHYVDEKKG